MCEQCQAKTITYEEKLFNEFFIVRATKDGDEMQKDDWGLVSMNNPFCIFSVTPKKNSYYETDYKDIPEQERKAYHFWRSQAKEFGEQIMSYINPTSMARLVLASVKNGYDPNKEELVLFECWLFHKIAEVIERSKHYQEHTED